VSLIAVDQNEGLDDTLVNRSEVTDIAPAGHTETAEAEEEGFLLEPVERAGFEKRVRKKRRLVVDTDKEFTGQQIKSQFDDYKDLLQPKCFPPPTKKAMMWKEMAGCDQLYSNPTFPSLGVELGELIVQNYSQDIPGEPAAENIIELDNIIDASRDVNVTSEDTSKLEPSVVEAAGPVDMLGELDNGLGGLDPLLDGVGNVDSLGEINGLGEEQREDSSAAVPKAAPEEEQLEDTVSTAATPKGVPDALDLDEQQSTEEQLSNELSEEFEQRRWTKRTQQVLRLLQKHLSTTEEVYFSTLTHKCNRKQAASRFYTCLLLAKEGMVCATQPEPYADIILQKGPKYVE
jgi:cohesin complex subunit SCC1